MKRGRPRKTTPELELQACYIAKDHGLEVAAKRCGVDPRTIKRWMVERGLVPRRNMVGTGAAALAEQKGFSYTLLFDSEENVEFFKRFCALAESGWPEHSSVGDCVAEALRGVMQ